MTPEQLKNFERRVADAFEAGTVRGPIHLSGGNEDQLIEIFRDIHPVDWVFSTWRSHYHALLHGVTEDWLMAEILAGRSMGIMSPAHRFFTSAIVAGIMPIAVGVAAAIRRNRSGTLVHCFVGDMTAETGIAHESIKYAERHELPIRFYVEDNGLSCNTPTQETWGNGLSYCSSRVSAQRTYPHAGIGKWVTF